MNRRTFPKAMILLDSSFPVPNSTPKTYHENGILERKEDFALTYAHGDNHPNGDYGCSQSTPIIHPSCLGNGDAYNQSR